MKKASQSHESWRKGFLLIKEVDRSIFDVKIGIFMRNSSFCGLKGEVLGFIGDHIQSFQSWRHEYDWPNLPHLWRSDQAYFQSENRLWKLMEVVILFSRRIIFLTNSVFDLEDYAFVSALLNRSASGFLITGKGLKRKWKMRWTRLGEKKAWGVLFNF